MTIKNRLAKLETQHPQHVMTWRELIECDDCDLPGWAEFIAKETQAEGVTDDDKKQAATA